MHSGSANILFVITLVLAGETSAQQPSSIPRLNRRMESFYYRMEGKYERMGNSARAAEMRQNAEIYGGGPRTSNSSQSSSRSSYRDDDSYRSQNYEAPVRKEPEVTMPPMGELYEVPPHLAGNSLGLGLYAEVGQGDWASVLKSLLEALKGEEWSLGALAAEHNYPLGSARMDYSKFREVILASGLRIHSEPTSLTRPEVKTYIANGRPIVVQVNSSAYGRIYGLILSVTRNEDQTQIYFPVRANRFLTDGVGKLFPGGAGYTRFMVLEGKK